MQQMRALLSLVVCLAACVPAQAADGAGSKPAAAPQPQVQALPPQMPAAKPLRFVEPERKPSPGLAFVLTDDADSTRLPAFAMRTTVYPTRLLRVGVEFPF